jgi:alanyl-tRNA synthetase
VLLASAEGDKVTLVAGISRELEARGLSAGEWIKEPATIVGGRGGGKPDLAQAGGKQADKLPAALDAARKSITSLLGG